MLKDEQGMFSYSLNGKSGDYTMISRCPSGYSPEIYEITTESKRSVGQGACLNAEYLATKYKFNFTWNYMSDEQFAEIAMLKRKRMFFFWIKIVDPAQPSKGLQYFNVYCGDLKGTAVNANVSDGRVKAWKDVTMNLTER